MCIRDSVGGYLTDSLSWRWVFFVNIPFAFIAALAVGSALVSPRPSSRPRIDYRCAVLLSGTVTLLLLALGQATGGQGFAWGRFGTLLGGALILWVAFIHVERRAADPLIPFELFGDRVIGPAMLSGFLVGVAMFGAISFVPLFVQAALGGSAIDAGSALTPLLLGWVLMSIVTGRVLMKVGYRRMVFAGLSCVSFGFFQLSQIDIGASLWMIRAVLAIMGVGMGMTILTLILAVQNAVPRNQLGIATSLGHFTRSIGGAFGVATMGAIVVVSLPAGGDASPQQLTAALQRVFMFGAFAAGSAVISSFWFPKGLPQERLPDGAASPVASVTGETAQRI